MPPEALFALSPIIFPAVLVAVIEIRDWLSRRAKAPHLPPGWVWVARTRLRAVARAPWGLKVDYTYPVPNRAIHGVAHRAWHVHQQRFVGGCRACGPRATCAGGWCKRCGVEI